MKTQIAQLQTSDMWKALHTCNACGVADVYTETNTAGYCCDCWKGSSMIEVDTRVYVRSHMRSPRGFGSWAFCLGKLDYDKVEEVFWVNQANYGDAVKAAKVEAKKRGVTLVSVLP